MGSNREWKRKWKKRTIGKRTGRIEKANGRDRE